MSLETLIETYGYVTILVGTFLEGETILVLGGFAAHRGYLALWGVVAAAFAGSLCGDQLFFFLGRRHSHWLLERRPNWKNRVERVHRLLDRYQTPMILSFRFLYGLRTVSPFVIGMSPVSTAKFIVLNAVGALVWAVAIGTGGYMFGHALEIIIGDIQRFETIVFALVAAGGTLIWALHLHRRRKMRNRTEASRKAH
jgi:membrane protein DedA with SNARE-associated domain